MNAGELKTTLAEHAKWLNGAGGERANLANANLTGAYLANANLANANLTGAYLANANLANANLTNANLTRAYLANANLANANLANANLTWANLANANLADANLGDAGIQHNKHLIGVAVGDWQMVLLKRNDAPLVWCGCRHGLTVDQARSHWSNEKEKWTLETSAWGAKKIRMLNFLLTEAKQLGWEV